MPKTAIAHSASGTFASVGSNGTQPVVVTTHKNPDGSNMKDTTT